MLRENLRITAVVVFLGLLVSCSKGDPISVQTQDRSAQAFMPPVGIITGMPNERAWDVDLASLVAGPNVPGYTPGYILDITNLGGQSCNYCAGVFLFTEAGSGAKPFCSWMSTVKAMAENPLVVPVSQYRVSFMGDNCAALYDMPKCDSCLIWDTSGAGQHRIELAVCYMVKPSGIGDWQIGVTINEWVPTPSQFPIFAPIQDVNKTWIWDNAEAPCWFPDISYDTYTGDLYLMYTEATNPAIVHYRRYDRASGTWTGPFVVHGDDHGGWTPRIDVGLVSNLPAWPGETRNTVGVAYSAYNQGDHFGKWHPCVVYWDVNDGDGDKNYGNNLIPIWDSNWPYAELNSGIPVLDIAPNSNYTNIGALVFTQEIGKDLLGVMHYRACEIDSVLAGPPPITPFIIEDSQNYAGCSSLLPAISIHYADQGDPRQASVSFFTEIGPGSHFPEYSRIDLDLPNSPPPGKLMIVNPILKAIMGDWEGLDVLEINPALSSSITVRLDNGYWMGFSDRVDKDGPPDPQMVWVSFGRSTL